MDIVDMVNSQVIAAVQKDEHYNPAKESSCDIVFLLKGNLMTIINDVDELENTYNKRTFIHFDLIDGLSSSRAAVEYISKVVKPTGIISTKPNVLKYAKEFDLSTIQRVFLFDTNALEKAISMARSSKPDALEIMPGIIPEILDQLTRKISFPIIAGGLINTPEEVHNILASGALAVSSTNSKVWQLGL
ncbi:glycerol-3-phosphate responsive antiterminator [Corticicoccus populi]|uniref:Glycerol uptake operon antiterminator regulatory protein n=1 Tax=Corticicoccus populi TaxID=1812821 RepID=A0ABW5WWE0_9STAP